MICHVWKWHNVKGGLFPIAIVRPPVGQVFLKWMAYFMENPKMTWMIFVRGIPAIQKWLVYMVYNGKHHQNK